MDDFSSPVSRNLFEILPLAQIGQSIYPQKLRLLTSGSGRRCGYHSTAGRRNRTADVDFLRFRNHYVQPQCSSTDYLLVEQLHYTSDSEHKHIFFPGLY